MKKLLIVGCLAASMLMLSGIGNDASAKKRNHVSTLSLLSDFATPGDTVGSVLARIQAALNPPLTPTQFDQLSRKQFKRYAKSNKGILASIFGGKVNNKIARYLLDFVVYA